MVGHELCLRLNCLYQNRIILMYAQPNQAHQFATSLSGQCSARSRPCKEKQGTGSATRPARLESLEPSSGSSVYQVVHSSRIERLCGIFLACTPWTGTTGSNCSGKRSEMNAKAMTSTMRSFLGRGISVVAREWKSKLQLFKCFVPSIIQ